LTAADLDALEAERVNIRHMTRGEIVHVVELGGWRHWGIGFSLLNPHGKTHGQPMIEENMRGGI